MFKSELTEQEAEDLDRECWRFKHRVQCFHADSPKATPKFTQKITSKVRFKKKKTKGKKITGSCCSC